MLDAHAEPAERMVRLLGGALAWQSWHPILTSYFLRLVSDQCETAVGSASVRMKLKLDGDGDKGTA